jgi:hypothetical protein
MVAMTVASWEMMKVVRLATRRDENSADESVMRLAETMGSQ